MARITKTIKGLFSDEDNTNANTDSSNDAKEQPYLMPGTETYEEYEKDLKECNPFKPDDEEHNTMELYNKQHAEKLKRKAVVNKNGCDTKIGTRKYKNYMDKITQVDDVRKSANKIADKKSDNTHEATVRKLSDKLLEEYAHNDGIVSDDYSPEVIDDIDIDVFD